MDIPTPDTPDTAVRLSPWCQVLSPHMHAYCHARECQCPHHLPPNTEPGAKVRRRPHSYPREDWKHRWAPGTAEGRQRRPS